MYMMSHHQVQILTVYIYYKLLVINLKNQMMTFEVDGMRVTQPLYPHKGSQYTDPVQVNIEMDFLENI